MNNKINVHIRIRGGSESIWTGGHGSLFYTLDGQQVVYRCFDSVLSLESNREIYKHHIKHIVEEFKSGKNGTVFAYGQTGSGKTYTMLGNGDQDGLVQIALSDLIQPGTAEDIELSFMELFNERMFDLYSRQELKMYSSHDQTICNAHVERTRHLDDALRFLETCENNRKTGATELNSSSSRSHAILQARRSNAVLCFIDLAGSERAGWNQERLREGSYINRSLLALGKLVNNLINSRSFGYRDSKLTRILQSSLDGNSNLAAVCTISPARRCLQESLSTLSFAARLSNLELSSKKEIRSAGTADGSKDEKATCTKIVDLYKKRIESLERTVLSLLEKHSDGKCLEIYILERQMFDMSLESLMLEQSTRDDKTEAG